MHHTADCIVVENTRCRQATSLKVLTVVSGGPSGYHVGSTSIPGCKAIWLDGPCCGWVSHGFHASTNGVSRDHCTTSRVFCTGGVFQPFSSGLRPQEIYFLDCDGICDGKVAPYLADSSLRRYARHAVSAADAFVDASTYLGDAELR